MEDIIYEEEPVREEIFSGTFILDGHMSEIEQRNKILKMMEVAGVTVEDPDSLEIGFDGAEDNEGLSETQTSRFHVFQNVTKKVPYRVTKEEVFQGSLILDPIRISPEEQKEKIFNMMRLSGVELGDTNTLEIGYDGVEDNDGLSETQTSPFVVYRVHKEKVEPRAKEELERSLDDIKKLRGRLESIVDSEERLKLIQELTQRTENLAKEVGSDTITPEEVSKDFKDIDEQIASLQKSLKDAAKEYEDSFHRMEAILDEQAKRFESENLTEEELDALREEFAHRKMEENEKSAQIRKTIEEQKKLLTNLKRKKNKLEKDVDMAEDLGISLPDFKEISDVLQKKNVMNAILDQKGLEDVVDKKASERTEEEKKEIKKAKEEVVKEISAAKKEKKEASILDLIEALYSVQVQYTQGKPPRVLLVKESQLDQIKKNVEKVPERIVGDAKVYDYHPEEIPVDLAEAEMNYHREEVFSGTYILNGERMSEAEQRKKIFDMMRIAGIEVEDESEFEIGYEGVEDNNGLSETQSTKFVVYRKIKDEKKVETKETDAKVEVGDLESRGFDERIVFFRDTANNNKIYVRDYVIKRFNIVPASEEVRIEESLCYQIENDDAEFIFGNQNNNYSPYFVESRDITLPKEEVVEDIPEEKVEEEIVIYHDADNNQEKYVKQETIVRFNLVPQSDATQIDGENYYRVSEDDAAFVIKNQQNNYSPYTVLYKEARLGARVEEEKITPPVPEERKELVERITIYRDLDNNNEVYVKKYVVERFNFVPISDQVRIDGAVCYRIENEDAGYLITNANNGYSPYEIDVQDIELGKRLVVDDYVQKLDTDDLIEKIVIYRDVNHDNDYYVKKYVCTRFNIVPTGPEVRIMKAACYKVNAEDIDFIIRNAHNNYSPYEVEIVDFSLEKDVVDSKEIFHNDGLLEKMTIYRDLDQNNQIYAKKYTVVRFNVVPTGPEVRIHGFLCYPISEEDAMFMVSNQDNGYSPYELEIENIHLSEVKDDERIVKVTPVEEKNEEPPVKETPVEEKTEEAPVKENPVEREEEKSEIVLYQNPEDSSMFYANKSTLTRFGIFPSGVPVEIEGEKYFPIRLEDEKRIRESMNQFMGENSTIDYREIPKAKEEVTVEEENMEPTYDSIMEKLFITPNEVGASRYTASNIHPTRQFEEELKDGDWAYNIVHFLTSLKRVSSDFLKKVSSKLLGTREGKNSMTAFQSKVDSLTEQEIEVLLKEYQNSHAAYEVNQMIVERIHEYLYDKLSKYERNICDEYESLYTLLGQIRVIEETLRNGGLSERANICFRRERDNKLIIAAEIAKNMAKEREEIQGLLGDNLTDLPELSRYPFAMLPYGRDLPKEYQNRLRDYQEGFRDAVNRNSIEDIVSNFMGMESCYYQSSDVAVRIVDSGEVGTKFFAPVVEEFGFKDDSFERDLFRVATASSVVVHDIELNQKNRINHEVPSPAYVVRMDSFNSNNIRRENLSSPEVDRELDKILLEYGSGTMSQEEALYQLDKVSRRNQSLLVNAVNEIIAALKPYAALHPEFDFEKVHNALEYVIAHPECIGSNSDKYQDVLGECLYGLPKDLLSCLISCASAVTLAHDVDKTMRKKYQINELSDMFKTPVEEENHPEKTL